MGRNNVESITARNSERESQASSILAGYKESQGPDKENKYRDLEQYALDHPNQENIDRLLDGLENDSAQDKLKHRLVEQYRLTGERRVQDTTGTWLTINFPTDPISKKEGKWTIKYQLVKAEEKNPRTGKTEIRNIQGDARNAFRINYIGSLIEAVMRNQEPAESSREQKAA